MRDFLDPYSHEKMVYRFENAAEQIDTSERELDNLCKEFEIRTFRRGRRRFIPAFELDRLLLMLLRADQQKRLAKHTNNVQAAGSG